MLANPKPLPDYRLAHPGTQQLPDLVNIGNGQFGHAMASSASRVALVLGSGDVLKIFNVIVRLVAVLVIDLFSIGTEADERSSDNSMNGCQSAEVIFGWSDPQISLVIGRWFQNHSNSGVSASTLAANTAKVADGIPSLPSDYRTPLLTS